MRILALIGDRPVPALTGAAVRNLHLWSRLANRQDVELKVLALDLAGNSVLEPPRFPGVDAEFFRFGPRSLWTRAVGAVGRSWHEYPRSPALIQRVDELAAAFQPDVIHAEELRMAAYLPVMRSRPAPALSSVTFHNVESDLFARMVSPSPLIPGPVRGLSARLQVRSLKQFESRVVASVRLRLAYSEIDRQRYASLYPNVSWKTTRNGTDVEGVTPAPQSVEPSVLMLARWSYAPNIEGLRWFLNEVRPHLDPALKVVIAGSAASETLKGWIAEAGWPFHDSPLDLAPLYARASAVAVPVLQGSGTRGKILEALAHERVVVTTTKGPEGLDLGTGSGITIADDPRQFAETLTEAATSAPESRAEAAHKGRQAVLANYDWSVVAAELLETWRSCMSP